MASPRSFLVIQTAFIGDVILATAMVESLHQKFPEASIDFLLRKGNEDLLAGHPFIREVLIFDKNQKYRNLFLLIKKIRTRHYDIVINAQRFATTGIITVLSGASRTIGFSKNPLSGLFSEKYPHHLDGRHEVSRNQVLIESLTSDPKPRPRLYPTAFQFEKVKSLKEAPFITVSPASVWFTKQFPASQWIAFLKSLPDHLTVYLLGAKSDAALCQALISSTPGKQIKNLAGELSFLESAALMKDARMNYVNDSAPMHLASAMNASVCAVYCSTVPAFGFGPLSEVSQIVETREILSCRPCGLHGYRKCPEGHFKCALTIDIDELRKKLV